MNGEGNRREFLKKIGAIGGLSFFTILNKSVVAGTGDDPMCGSPSPSGGLWPDLDCGAGDGRAYTDECCGKANTSMGENVFYGDVDCGLPNGDRTHSDAGCGKSGGAFIHQDYDCGLEQGANTFADNDCDPQAGVSDLNCGGELIGQGEGDPCGYLNIGGQTTPDSTLATPLEF